MYTNTEINIVTKGYTSNIQVGVVHSYVSKDRCVPREERGKYRSRRREVVGEVEIVDLE